VPAQDCHPIRARASGGIHKYRTVNEAREKEGALQVEGQDVTWSWRLAEASF
jgi:hypothetical protein